MATALEPFSTAPARSSSAQQRASWTAMLAAREQDVAPASPRDLSAIRDERIRPRTYAGLAALALVCLLSLAYASGWRVRITAPTLDEEAAVRRLTPVPTAGPLPVAAPTPTLAAATPTPGSLASSAAGAPTPPASCPAPEHPNPAVAETYRAMVEDACGTPVWEAVSEALDVAVGKQVEVRFGQPGGSAYGMFEASANRVTLAQGVANEAPRARAAVLLHEFTHVRDYYAGGMSWSDDLLACYEVERRAFQAEVSFWRVSQAKHGSPKPATALESDLEYISQALARGSADFVARDLVSRYGASCKPPGGP